MNALASIHADGVKYTENGNEWVLLPPDTIVSMNFWGFTPSLFDELELCFRTFLTEPGQIDSAELFARGGRGDGAGKRAPGYCQSGKDGSA
jgi:hypothetical protein